MQDTVADIFKALRLLNWRPITTPAEGLAKTAEWHQGNREWLNAVDLK
jgi:nucleoside-diphosphate-sugar epimerase